MNVKIEMYIEVSKDDADDGEIKSHLQDALAMYNGNEIEFWSCEVEKCFLPLEKFPEDYDGQKLLCLETFEATHTNVISGKLVHLKRTFEAGNYYRTESWRPEGRHINGFFVFHENADKFALS